jgi:hypothetical protein
MPEERNKILEIIAVAAALYLLWRLFSRRQKVTVEPATTAPEFGNIGKQEECEHIYYKPLSGYGPFPSKLLGPGWCYRGDGSFFDGKKVAYGDPYAEEQAKAYTDAKQAEAIRVTNRDVIQFRLINTTAIKQTTSFLNTTKQPDVFNGTFDNPTPPTPPTPSVMGVGLFSGSQYISFGSVPDSTGNQTIRFKMYIDALSSLLGPVLYFSSDTNDNIHIQLQNNILDVSPGQGHLGKRYDMSSYIGQILSFEIIKTASVIVSLSINGIGITEIGGSTYASGAITAFICWDNISPTGFNNGSVWDVEIVGNHKWAGHPGADTDSAWIDLIGSVNGAVNGLLTTRDL